MEAGREFLRLNKQNGDYYRIENTGNPREDYVNGYFTKGNQEVVMASFRWVTYYGVDKPFRMYESGYGIPRGNYADMFQWKDGSTFDWNNQTHRAHPFFDEKGQPNRDVRLYENLLVNGDKWQGRTAEVYKGGREGYGSGSSVQKKTQFGYGFRKFIRDKKNEMKGKPYSCPMIRMPEIYLSIAEAMNQLGKANVPDEFEKTAYDYLNLVHERAGLPAVTSAKVPQGDALLNYLLDERAREFGQEDVRYFDMIRHKKGAEWATRPMEMLETTKVGSGFEYVVSTRDDIKYYWNEYWYLLPLFTIGLLFISSVSLVAQEMMNGIVKDGSGKPLSGVKVSKVGEYRNNNVTDEDGLFSLLLKKGDYIELNYADVATKRIKITGDTLNLVFDIKKDAVVDF